MGQSVERSVSGYRINPMMRCVRSPPPPLPPSVPLLPSSAARFVSVTIYLFLTAPVKRSVSALPVSICMNVQHKVYPRVLDKIGFHEIALCLGTFSFKTADRHYVLVYYSNCTVPVLHEDRIVPLPLQHFYVSQ